MYEIRVKDNSIDVPETERSVITRTKSIITYDEFKESLSDTNSPCSRLYQEIDIATEPFFDAYDKDVISAAFLRDSVYNIIYEGMHALFFHRKQRKSYTVLLAQYMLLYLYEQYFPAK